MRLADAALPCMPCAGLPAMMCPLVKNQSVNLRYDTCQLVDCWRE